jgi:poly-gamma-glutamate synthesis protein (capsule biosynthesis protein)
MPRLAFVGDVMLGRKVGEAIAENGSEYPWGDTLGVLQKADLRIANLECPISERGTANPRRMFSFRAPALAADSLKAAGIDCVSLANIHILDYGVEALSDTIRILDEAGIAHSGAGRYIREAAKPALVERDGLRIAMISLTDNVPQWCAGENRAGVNYIPLWAMPDRTQTLRLNRLLGPALDAFSETVAAMRWKEIIRAMESSVSAARSRADFVILSCHWGPNWRTAPYGMFQKFAEAAVGGGAGMVHGHSAHVFQGVGVRNGRPVLFDTGDFMEDYPVMPLRNDQSFIFLLDIESKRPKRLTLVPVHISRCQVNLAPESIAGEICLRMEKLCARLGTKTRREGKTLAIDL